MTLAPYIHPAVLERLKSGAFVPERRSTPGALHLRERRDTLSPLAVTKRCIRYDHHVFINRKAQVLQLAESLNSPDKKLLMVSGPQGCGKTSLIRGIVELMGGGREQLLWFDVNIHTDFDEVIGFLIQSITTLCSALSRTEPAIAPAPPAPGAGGPPDPFARLDRLIERVDDVPLLIVIDNIEYLVNADHQLLSQPLKETLNYLLSFPNIKVALCGERMPYADIRARGPAVTHLELSGLSEPEMEALIAESSFPTLNARRMMALYRKTQGRPWLLKLLFYLQKKLAADPERHAAFINELDAFLDDRAAALPDVMKSLETASPVEPIIQFIYRRLSASERALAQALALIRHPVNTVTLSAMFPGLLPADREQAAAMLDHSLLTPLMKRIFSPQAVMTHVRKRHEPPSTFLPSYEFYRQARKLLAPLVPQSDQIQLHRALEAFYLRERDLPQGRRAYPVKSRILLEEARRHATMARQRRTGAGETRDGAGAGAIFRTDAPTLRQFPQPVRPEAPPAEIAPSSSARPPQTPRPSPEEPPPLAGSFRQALALAGQTEDDGLAPPMTPEATRFPSFSLAAPTPPLTPAPAMASITPSAPASETVESPEEGALIAEAEESGLRHQLADAVARRDSAGMAAALLALADFRQNAGRSQEAESCLRAALPHAPDLPPLPRAVLYRRWGRYCAETFRQQEALDALNKALEALESASGSDVDGLRREIDDQRGDLLAFQGRAHEALAAYFKAQDGATSPGAPVPAGDLDGRAERYFKIARLYDDLGMPDNALTYYEECLSLDRQSGSALSCAATLTNVGALQLERERPQEALAAFKAALEYDRQAQNAEGAHQTLMLMATAQLRLGEMASAEECYRQALANAIREDNSLWKANVYLKLGRLYLHQGDAERALVHYQSARASVDAAEASPDSLLFLDSQIKEALDVIQRAPAPDKPTPDPAG